MPGFWFKPQSYGYGATPTTWRGWLACTAYACLIAALGMLLLPGPTDPHGPLSWWRLAIWLAAVAFATVCFIRLARRRTDGEWRWRWGRQD